MTPDDLQFAIDEVVPGAVSGLPVRVVVDGQPRELDRVEVAPDGRLELHVGPVPHPVPIDL